jgi:hypothetical protein
MTKAIPLKYDPVSTSKVNEILSKYKGNEILSYIVDLFNLIEYQKQIIFEQEKHIIAFKYDKAWKHYDKPIEKYDPLTRKYIE